jgi:hypothetical protein
LRLPWTSLPAVFANQLTRMLQSVDDDDNQSDWQNILATIETDSRNKNAKLSVVNLWAFVSAKKIENVVRREVTLTYAISSIYQV